MMVKKMSTTAATSSMIDQRKLRPLIDGDIMLYACGFAADSQIKKEYKEHFPEASDEEVAQAMAETEYTNYALGNVKSVLDDICAMFSKDYKLYLTGAGNFREQIATILPYKGNRDETHKPKYYRDIKDYLKDFWNATTIFGREADDALGCEQWAHKDRSTVIVTIDKDLNQIPGYHYNWRKNLFFDVSLTDANAFFWYQMLDGDKTDNIPGIKGLGEKKIPKLFNGATDIPTLRAIVQEQYKKQYGPDWERAYHEVADLLWMQRVEGKTCPFL